MIVKQYIKDFEKLGFGMFVHFGLYSILGTGEWAKHLYSIPDEDYGKLTLSFDPEKDWAEKLVCTAKNAGCRYITLTTRHHDGFSLYDTKGLSDYDAPHALCGRDLVREFTDACYKHGVRPFFYHTLLDWHEKTFNTDFKAYLLYLRRSVEILCTNYGDIGGIWFDGTWSKPEGTDWEEDALYSMIRSYLPNAMIINNTGLDARGKLGHPELDSVTFERGKPQPVNTESAPKYVASEMCEVFGEEWGYAEDDLNYKSPAEIIRSLCDCRRYGANFLLNVGPMADGYIRELDKAYFSTVGHWMGYFSSAVYSPRPTDIAVKNKNNDFILREGNTLYLFCYELGGSYDGPDDRYVDVFDLDEPIKSVVWLDTDKPLEFARNGGEVRVKTEPYKYGRHLVVRVAKIELGTAGKIPVSLN